MITNHEVQRILIQIEQLDDPNALKEIGQASDNRLDTLGYNQQSLSLVKLAVLSLLLFVILALGSVIVWRVSLDTLTVRLFLQAVVLFNAYNFAHWFVERF